MKLSVLDFATVHSGMSNADALAQTIELARTAESLGYHRFWLAEHHGMPNIASSATAVLIGAIAAATSSIRVGSGGIMLPNHSSLIVAEQFGTLVALHGDRIDLGLGRSAGTDALTTSILRRGTSNDSPEDFPNQVVELLAWFGTIPPLENGIGGRVIAVPGLGDSPEVWLLGTSDYSAQLAGHLGVRFAFAHQSMAFTPRAFDAYREAFRPSSFLDEPYSIVSLSALVADDDADAQRLMLPASYALVRAGMGQRNGRAPTQDEAEAHPWSEAELARAAERNAEQAIGDGNHARARIAELIDATGANEAIVMLQGSDQSTKVKTLRELIGKNT